MNSYASTTMYKFDATVIRCRLEYDEHIFPKDYFGKGFIFWY